MHCREQHRAELRKQIEEKHARDEQQRRPHKAAPVATPSPQPHSTVHSVDALEKRQQSVTIRDDNIKACAHMFCTRALMLATDGPAARTGSAGGQGTR